MCAPGTPAQASCDTEGHTSPMLTGAVELLAAAQILGNGLLSPEEYRSSLGTKMEKCSLAKAAACANVQTQEIKSVGST